MEKSYWQEVSLPSFPALEQKLTVDAVVIGAGITGITAAYLLKRAGVKVALIERGLCGQVDTGHTTAHLTCVTDTQLHDMVKQFGKDHAREVWEAGLSAIDVIEHNVKEEGIECEFKRIPGYLHTSLKDPENEDAADLRDEAKTANELGFDAAFMEAVPFFKKPGVRVSNQAKFHPLKYLAGLVKTIPGEGSYVCEQSEVEEVSDKPLRVKANGHWVNCQYVVVATHTPLQGKSSTVSAALFQTKLIPTSSYVIGAKLPKGMIPEASFWDTTDPYYYLRIDAKEEFDYAIFGGEDHKTGQVTDTEEVYRKLEATLREFAPQAEIDHRWSGQVVETNDGLPFIGELTEGQFIATGFAGNGMTFGTVAAVMASSAYLKKHNPWKELFDPHRKKVLGGTWDYVKQNVDYPYYMIRDRLKGAEANSVESVGPGEGKIVKVDGKKLAVYRAADGQVTQLSPVCPHLGCIVHWNGAEKTWDCPCHGSRFGCTGEVINGPAEEALENAEKVAGT